jgi:hypothetical protein
MVTRMNISWQDMNWKKKLHPPPPPFHQSWFFGDKTIASCQIFIQKTGNLQQNIPFPKYISQNSKKLPLKKPLSQITDQDIIAAYGLMCL